MMTMKTYFGILLFWLVLMAAADPLPAGSPPVDWPLLSFTPATTNIFNQPVVITHAGDGSGRLFVVQQPGQILILQNGKVLAPPFLNISNRVSNSYPEQGLLGLAFPPGYSTKNHFYVDYTRVPDGAIVISRFFPTATNANVADANSEQILKVIPKPGLITTYNNHNGGQLAFGPDGYLYIGVGDGGSEGDPLNDGQKTNTLFGKLLRIDVESSVTPYAIPANNPFVNSNGYAPEIWAYGLRNPWRFSFDRQTGDLYIGDVGENRFEEVDFQPYGSAGGQNYGWNIMEGNSNYSVPVGFTNFTALTPPVATYSHVSLPTDLGGAIIGGYVYRGPDAPRMNGMYFYGDFVAGWIWGLKASGTNWQNLALVTPDHPPATHFSISTFGDDDPGRLYVADYYKGKIYQIQDSLQVWPPVFAATNGFINSNIVVVTCLTTNAEIHYTTNGIDPTLADPIVVSGGTIPALTGFTNKARAFRSDLTPSAVVVAIFTNLVGAPFFVPPPGAILSNTTVSIGTATPGAAIYYTTDGTTPTTSSPLYTGPITLSGNLTVLALGVFSGFSNSTVAIASYSAAQVAWPTFTPLSGPITNGTQISMSCTTTGAVIHYTLNRTTPTTSSPVYSSPVTINGGTTVSAIAVAAGYVNSQVESIFYQLVQAASPSFSPLAGPLAYGTDVSITCATPGSTIYYTLDGTMPTTGSPVYSTPLIIDADTTLNAYATAPQHLDSAVQSSAYTLFKAAAPTYTPAQGPLTNGALITISTATTNATICYTFDGSTPTTNSSVYSGPLLFTNAITLTACAFRSDLDPSSPTSFFYGLSDFERTVVTTFAGGGGPGFSNTISALAKFSNPEGICRDKNGNLYVADTGNNVIRMISAAGQVTTLAGNGSAGSALGTTTNAEFAGPTGVAVDKSGNVYVADGNNCNRVCKIDTNGVVSLLANVRDCYYAPGLWQLTVDGAGNVYLGSWATVQEVTPDGSVVGLAGTGCNCSGWSGNVGPAIDSATNIYAATGGYLWKVVPGISSEVFAGGNSGVSDGPRLVAAFYNLQDAAVDSATNIFLSDTSRIKKLGANGWVSTLAGSGIYGFQNGSGMTAQFGNAAGLCVDTNGNVYVADSANNCIREISPDTCGIGIPDWWQLAHFGHLGIDPNADPDHDGMSNYDEFWAGTDPNNPSSVFKIVKATTTGGATQITWYSVPGKNYVVQYSTDLISWTAIGGTLQGTGSEMDFNDPAPLPNSGSRFYRVSLTNF